MILIFPFKSKITEDLYYEPYTNLNPICFHYLRNLCYVKIKKLTNLSVIEQVSMERVIPLFLELCEKRIILIKEKKRG
jgi:hypothetical protein